MLTALTLFVALSVQSDYPSSPVEPEPDETSNQQRQVERLMNAGLPFAEKMLSEHGEFMPFGAVMLPEGKIQTVGADDGGVASSAEELYEALVRGLKQGAVDGSYRATATFVNVRMRNPADGETIEALHVALEHESGYCVDVFYPLIRDGETAGLGESFAGRRVGTFFDCE